MSITELSIKRPLLITVIFTVLILFGILGYTNLNYELLPKFDAGVLESCRNPEYPSQYVETIYSLGKWVFPRRLPSQFSNCFWRYSQSGNLYLFTQTSEAQQGE